MRYTQLCKRDRDIVEFSYPLSTQKFTAKPIQRLIDRALDPEQRRDQVGLLPQRRCPDRPIRRPRRESEPRAPGYRAQQRFPARLHARRRQAVGVDPELPAQRVGGWLFPGPGQPRGEGRRRPSRCPRRSIFVIDRSGSMAGKKIEQARKALKSVLNNLRDEDLFNIVVYDDRVESFKPELQRYGSSARDEADPVRRQYPRRGKHQHRLGPEDGPGDDPGHVAAELRALPHRRPAHGRRDARAVDRRQLPPGQRTPGSRLLLRGRLRRQRPAPRSIERRK